jgi:hypothetical protein
MPKKSEMSCDRKNKVQSSKEENWGIGKKTKRQHGNCVESQTPQIDVEYKNLWQIQTRKQSKTLDEKKPKRFTVYR